MKDLPLFLLGIPSFPQGQKAAHIAEYIPVPGSSVLNCDFCHQGVVLGPRQRQFRTENPLVLIGCPLCLKQLQGPDKIECRTLGGASATFKLTDGTVIKP